MSLLLAWVVCPLVLALLCVGCGLLVERATGATLPRALLPALGLATLVVAGRLAALAQSTALTVAFVVALAVAGYAFAGPGRLRLPRIWPLAAVLAIFAVYAAPIVLSGQATFAGYIKLDDTATWLAITDQVVAHGGDLGGLAPSTHEATLSYTVGRGYPVGAFIPLGIAGALIGQDVAWLIQPYMATLAALLALTLWALTAPLRLVPSLRALGTFVAAQAALLYGHYLWGGVKEILAATLIAASAAFAAEAIRRGLGARSLLPLALVALSLAASLSLTAVVWLGPAALAVSWAAWKGGPPVAARWGLAALGAGALVVAGLALGGWLSPTRSVFTSGGELGNLIRPLPFQQVAGIWPAGDFRFDPEAPAIAVALIALLAAAATSGLVLAWRARATGAILYPVGALAIAVAAQAIASPWLAAKALAIASPAIPFAAAIAGAVMVQAGRRVAGAALLTAMVAAVLWSNALAYRDVNLAPRDQLAELERIGEDIAGQGPALMTEYQPYGVRHFLREADAEGASELRRRRIPLRDGALLDTGEHVDTDELRPRALLGYRTLVLRRSPSQSRPPSAYELVWRGEHYEVWQRPPGTPEALPRLPIGNGARPDGQAACSRLLGLARRADDGTVLAAARRPRPVFVPLSDASHPSQWRRSGDPDSPIPLGRGEITAGVTVRHAGAYEVWLGGSVRQRAELLIDGRRAGSARHDLNNEGQYVRLGGAPLAPGRHEVAIRFRGTDLHPGSGGVAEGVGPLVLTRADAGDSVVSYHGPARARALCGKRLDWVELVRR